jgi:hypothetical protein
MSKKRIVEWPVNGRVWEKTGRYTEDGKDMYHSVEFDNKKHGPRRRKVEKELQTRRDIRLAIEEVLKTDA